MKNTIRFRRRNYYHQHVLDGERLIGNIISTPQGWAFQPATSAPCWKFVSASRYCGLTQVARALQRVRRVEA